MRRPFGIVLICILNALFGMAAMSATFPLWPYLPTTFYQVINNNPSDARALVNFIGTLIPLALFLTVAALFGVAAVSIYRFKKIKLNRATAKLGLAGSAWLLLLPLVGGIEKHPGFSIIFFVIVLPLVCFLYFCWELYYLRRPGIKEMFK